MRAETQRGAKDRDDLSAQICNKYENQDVHRIHNRCIQLFRYDRQAKSHGPVRWTPVDPAGAFRRGASNPPRARKPWPGPGTHALHSASLALQAYRSARTGEADVIAPFAPCMPLTRRSSAEAGHHQHAARRQLEAPQCRAPAPTLRRNVAARARGGLTNVMVAAGPRADPDPDTTSALLRHRPTCSASRNLPCITPPTTPSC